MSYAKVGEKGHLLNLCGNILDTLENFARLHQKWFFYCLLNWIISCLAEFLQNFDTKKWSCSKHIHNIKWILSKRKVRQNPHTFRTANKELPQRNLSFDGRLESITRWDWECSEDFRTIFRTICTMETTLSIVQIPDFITTFSILWE